LLRNQYIWNATANPRCGLDPSSEGAEDKTNIETCYETRNT
jgi:hypothetical protein